MKPREHSNSHSAQVPARAEAERERLLARYQPIMESIRDAVALADPSGRVVYHNPASLALHGYADLQEAILTGAETAPQWYIRDSAGRPVPVDQWPLPRVLRGDSFNSEELRVCRLDTGKEFIGSYSGKMLRNGDGDPMFAMLTIRDITVQKHAGEVLRSSENRYRSLFTNMTEGFALHEIITDAEGSPSDYRFLEVNPAFEQLTGLKRADLIGRRILEVLPGTEAYWIENYGRVALTGEPVHFDNYSAGLGRWYEVLAYQSAPMQFATIFKDITGRKQAEERARREHRETVFANRILRAFIEYEGETLFEKALAVVQEEMVSQYGVFGYIAQPGHLMCPSLSKMLDVCEIDGKCIHYPPQKWKGLWARALKEKRSIYTNQAPPVPPGHPIIHNNLATPILFHGEVIGLLNIANNPGGYTDADRDTLDHIAARIAPVLYAWIQRKLREDERTAAEEALRRFNETLERQVAERTGQAKDRSRQLQALAVELIEAEERERRRIAQVLHDDLQQMLAGTRLLLQSISAILPPIPEIGEVQQLLEESIKKSRSLSHELSPAVLRHSGLIAALEWLTGQMKVQFSLNTILRNNTEISLENPPIKVFVFRAVQELLFNIVKHAGVGSARIEISSSGDHFCVTVSDRGKGFNPEVLSRYNDKIGFGLLTIRERANYIGAQLLIESAPDRGSRFTLKIPLSMVGIRQAQPELASGAVQQQLEIQEMPAIAPAAGVIRVLFADDHKVIRQGLIKLIAGQPGIHVVGEAANGLEALDQARRLNPDVIVMDISMPELDGIEATRRVRAELPEVRVVGLTMHDDVHITNSMCKAGAESVMNKASSPAQLLKAIYGVAREKNCAL